MIKTVLITGGGGFIGSHIIDLLLAKDYQIIILERSPSGLQRIQHHLSKIKAYYSESSKVDDIFCENKIDCVIHLAARYIKNHSSIQDVEEILDTNVKFSSTLVEACRLHNVKHFINTGTFFEYQASNKPIKEGGEKKACNLYAASKTAFGDILKYYAENYDIKAANLYLFSPFGDRDNEKLMAFLVKGLASQEKIDFSGGEQSWNFTYVKDIALAYLSVLENFDKINGFVEFNVGYSEAISIRNIVKKLEEISGKKLNISWGAKPYVENEIFYANCDNSKIKEILGWQPKYDIDYGLRETYKYYSERKQND